MTEVLKGTVNIPPTVIKHQAIESRCWWRAIWISDRSMSCELSTGLALTGRPSRRRSRSTLRALRPLLADPEVTELCINRPARGLPRNRAAAGSREALPFADFDWCSRLAKLVANSTQQRIDATSPLLVGLAPGGERVQIVLPPATTAGCVAIAIRRPAERCGASRSWRARHLPRAPAAPPMRSTTPSRNCCGCWRHRDYTAFMRLAVRSRKNILVSGPTGSARPPGPRR